MLVYTCQTDRDNQREASTVTNRYPGTCRKCGQTVHPEQGTCEKVGGKWVVERSECPAPEAAPELQDGAIQFESWDPGGGPRSVFPKAGDVVDHEGQWVVIVSSRYGRDEEGSYASMVARPATAEEAAPHNNRVERNALLKRNEARRREIIEMVKAGHDGTEIMPEGRKASARRGTWFVVGVEHIWYCLSWDESPIVDRWHVPYEEALAQELDALVISETPPA
jgi:hypothetical protein